jgi:hypothetical protein
MLIGDNSAVKAAELKLDQAGLLRTSHTLRVAGSKPNSLPLGAPSRHLDLNPRTENLVLVGAMSDSALQLLQVPTASATCRIRKNLLGKILQFLQKFL